ncbi:MAG: OmpA family protein [Candidatus Eiseniibacteriota bacterium]
MHKQNTITTRHLAGGAVVLGLLGALATPASAEEAKISTPPASALAVGPYVGAAGGLNIQRDTDVSGPGFDGSVDSNLGWAGLLSLGYRFRNGLRTEIEGGYRRNNVDEIDNCPTCGDDGFTQAFSLMANALYDFNINGSPLHPYIGAGAGAAKVRAGGIGPVPGTSINDSDWAFAYQGIAGVSYAVSKPVELFAEYRYFATQGLDLSAPVAGGTVSNDDEYRNHTIMAGLRWYFGAQPETPVVAATPAKMETPAPVPRNYTVFFDFDRSDLTAQGQNVVATAAANAKRGHVTTIDATGYTDRSGPAAYNLDLSRRRAETVKAELVRLGVPAGEIVVAWKGENDNLVPTADGVREPQNRRVTVIYQ